MFYDEYFDDVLCPQYRALHYATTNREGYREYRSRSYLCRDCPTRELCTVSAKCEKTVTRHVWQNYVEMAEDARYMTAYKDLYHLRKEKIERVFADAKEKHAMRYTQYRGLTQVTNWVKLKFAAMNLKKLATWKWRRLHPQVHAPYTSAFLRKAAAFFRFSSFYAKSPLWFDFRTGFFYRLKSVTILGY